jgi:hypothetical protein
LALQRSPSAFSGRLQPSAFGNCGRDIAELKGTDVDLPRNLAKVVTVE